MKLRVRADAKKGHWVGNRRYEPGEVLPGEFICVPLGMEYKIEEVPEGQASATPAAQAAPARTTQAEPAPNGPARPYWYAQLASELGKDEPTKDDLVTYAENEFGEKLDHTLKKDEMVAAIDKLEAESPG